MIHDTTRRMRSILVAALLFVAAFAAPVAAQIPPCGDGFLDVGEECDEGPATGAPDSCCAIDCTFRPALTPCRATTGECDPADVCSGSSGTCVDAKRTDVCRPAAGVCDIEESCDGVASDCPADAFAPVSLACRASAGVCDLAETCTGTAAACPADAFEPGSVECRPSAGVCDVAEQCSGSAAACPADAKSTAECRAMDGVCDVAESCDGIADTCPADAFEPGSVECRPSAGACDVAEQCTGSAGSCPANGFQPDNTPCNDGNICSVNDRCITGICGGFLENCGNGITEVLCAEECDDGNLTAGDGCTGTCHLEPCGPEPFIGCRAPTIAGKTIAQIISRLSPEQNKMQWKYSVGDTTPVADFGDPTAATSYQFCIWEEVGGDPRLSASYAIPAGGVCGVGPCWKANSSGFKFSDKAHTSDGISGLTLKQGLTPGKTKISLKGKGANLPTPVLPFIQSPNVVMQLRASNGVCWEARYDMPAFRNQPDQFRDK